MVSVFVVGIEFIKQSKYIQKFNELHCFFLTQKELIIDKHRRLLLDIVSKECEQNPGDMCLLTLYSRALSSIPCH